jgi:uncharacterized membrane protein YoaK (UPF0700 family)
MGIALPRWVWVAAVLLSGVAGMVNVIAYLGSSHQVVSHLTGTTSLLGAALAATHWQEVGLLWGVLIAFCAGATLSGLVIQDSTLQPGRRYGVALLLEALLLCAAVPLLQHHPAWGIWCAAAACGLQNALATTFSGAIVRTTHLSGMFTDLGIGLGHLLRGMPLQVRRLTLSGLIIGGFLAGSIAGTWLFDWQQQRALFVPAAITGAAGALHLLHRQWRAMRHPAA